jgi:hypothetical protein
MILKITILFPSKIHILHNLLNLDKQINKKICLKVTNKEKYCHKVITQVLIKMEKPMKVPGQNYMVRTSKIKHLNSIKNGVRILKRKRRGKVFLMIT